MTSDADALFAKLSKLIYDANEKQTKTLKLEIQAEVSGVKSEIAELKKIIEKEKDKLNKLEEKQTDLQTTITTLEKSLKKNNVIIFGLNQDNNQNSLADYTIQKLNQLLDLDLTVDCLNNIYLLGKSNANRPSLVQFQSYLTKVRVLKQCRKLKGTGVSITEDLTREDREKQKILIKHKNLAKSKGYKAYIKKNKLYVNNEEYSTDDLKDQIYFTLPDTPEKQNINKERKINSAPATPTIEVQEDSEEESDVDDTANDNKLENNLLMRPRDTTSNNVERRNQEDSKTSKQRTETAYAEGHRKKKSPVTQKITTEGKKIITRSVNK